MANSAFHVKRKKNAINILSVCKCPSMQSEWILKIFSQYAVASHLGWLCVVELGRYNLNKFFFPLDYYSYSVDGVV